MFVQMAFELEAFLADFTHMRTLFTVRLQVSCQVELALEELQALWILESVVGV